MTVRTLVMGAATFQQAVIDVVDNTPPTLQPPAVSTGRFVWYANAKGVGVPGLTADASPVFLLWDWESATSRYKLVKAFPNYSPTGDSYAPIRGQLAFVDATTLMSVSYWYGTTATSMGRALMNIAANGTVTYTGANYNAYTEPGTATNTAARSNPTAYSGNLLYGLNVGGYPTTNGYVYKVSSSAAVRNSTALRSSLPADSTQGRPVRSMAQLGGATPNGYVVAEVTDFVSGGTTCRYQLVNCTGTPAAVGTQLSYAGSPATGSVRDYVLPLGSTKVVAFDFPSGGMRASLLNTNSSTAPTTLTKGAEVTIPPPPGYTAGQISLVIADPRLNAVNNNFPEGSTVVWVAWYPAAGGVVELPVLLQSSSASTITATVLNTDITGKVLSQFAKELGPILSAPGNKAVVFAKSTATGLHEQFVYQL